MHRIQSDIINSAFTLVSFAEQPRIYNVGILWNYTERIKFDIIDKSARTAPGNLTVRSTGRVMVFNTTEGRFICCSDANVKVFPSKRISKCCRRFRHETRGR